MTFQFHRTTTLSLSIRLKRRTRRCWRDLSRRNGLKVRLFQILVLPSNIDCNDLNLRISSTSSFQQNMVERKRWPSMGKNIPRSFRLEEIVCFPLSPALRSNAPNAHSFYSSPADTIVLPILRSLNKVYGPITVIVRLPFNIYVVKRTIFTLLLQRYLSTLTLISIPGSEPHTPARQPRNRQL